MTCEEDKIISIYYICDELFKNMKFQEHYHTKAYVPEIATIAIVSSYMFYGNHQRALWWFRKCKFFNKVLSASRFNRRLHKISKLYWSKLLSIFTIFSKENRQNNIFLIDSFPVATSQLMRSFCVKRFSGKEYIGRDSSRKRFFQGIKVHMLTDSKGCPVEYAILPGSVADLKGLYELDLDLPFGSVIIGDKAYYSKGFEEYLQEFEGKYLLPVRKKKAKNQYDPFVKAQINKFRKRIETTFSSILRLLPRSIAATTEKGYLLKLELFILSKLILINI